MAVLTIDDAPSTRFAEKLARLRKEKIPAVFFIWGEKATAAEDLLVEALRAGYPLGNHSWTHPHFSTLNVAAAREEIRRTDELLAGLYARAGKAWDRKYFRFPYFDRGGEGGREAAFQTLLAEGNYESLDAARSSAERPGAVRSHAARSGTARKGGADAASARRDTLCGFDQKEYWLGNPEAPDGLDRAETILSRIGPGNPAADSVILIHDHEYSHDLFFECLGRYRELGVSFTLP